MDSLCFIIYPALGIMEVIVLLIIHSLQGRHIPNAKAELQRHSQKNAMQCLVTNSNFLPMHTRTHIHKLYLTFGPSSKP